MRGIMARPGCPVAALLVPEVTRRNEARQAGYY